jgi:hypothetical protein
MEVCADGQGLQRLKSERSTKVPTTARLSQVIERAVTMVDQDRSPEDEVLTRSLVIHQPISDAGPVVCIFHFTNRSCLAHQLRMRLPYMYVGIASKHSNADVPPKVYIISVGPLAATQLFAKFDSP